MDLFCIDDTNYFVGDMNVASLFFGVIALCVSGDVDVASVSAEGNEEWVVALDTAGELHIRLGK